jgi:hypothetical protein
MSAMLSGPGRRRFDRHKQPERHDHAREDSAVKAVRLVDVARIILGVLIAIVAAEDASISNFSNSSGFDCSTPGFVDTGFTGHFVRSGSHTAWHRV